MIAWTYLWGAWALDKHLNGSSAWALVPPFERLLFFQNINLNILEHIKKISIHFNSSITWHTIKQTLLYLWFSSWANNNLESLALESKSLFQKFLK